MINDISPGDAICLVPPTHTEANSLTNSQRLVTQPTLDCSQEQLVRAPTILLSLQGAVRGSVEQRTVLNNDPEAAIQYRQKMISKLGRTEFYVGQRSVGVARGGADYGYAFEYIYDYLNEGHITDRQATFYSIYVV
jgi:hypothetical protein